MGSSRSPCDRIMSRNGHKSGKRDHGHGVWTNMLQPFWALPLLGITGLKARDILPYTLAALLVSGLVFVVSLLLLA